MRRAPIDADLTADGWHRDLAAGVLLTAVLVPAGLGYAAAAGLPPVAGLHASVAGLLAYELLGRTPALVVGPDSSVIPLVAASVLPYAASGSDGAVPAAALLALLVGMLLVVGSRLRLGRIVELLSMPIRLGFLHGVAIVVIIGQLPTLLGAHPAPGGTASTVVALVGAVTRGELAGTVTVIGCSSLAASLLLRRLRPRWPGLLVVVVATTIATAGLDLSVPTVGTLPRAWPSLLGGSFQVSDVAQLLPTALAVAAIALADTAALARALTPDASTIDPDREMLGLGAANVAAGIIGGFPVSASGSRSMVLRGAGATGRRPGLIGAALTVGLLVFAPGAARDLPTATLAAVVIAAASLLLDPAALRRLARMSRVDFVLAAVAACGVVAFGALVGVAIAIALSLGVFVSRVWHPHTAELVRVDGRKGYHDLERHPSGKRVPGLVIFRFDAPLFFANAEHFAAAARRRIAAAPGPIRWLLVAAEPITDIDVTAATMLTALVDELRGRDIRLVFAELKGPIADTLDHFGLRSQIVGPVVFPTLGTAVSAYVRDTHTAWQDWTDRTEPGGDGR